jgi:hypothetical protein
MTRTLYNKHVQEQADDIEEHLWYNAVLPPEEQASLSHTLFLSFSLSISLPPSVPPQEQADDIN